MKTFLTKFSVACLILGGLTPVFAFFDKNVDEIVAEANSDTVEGVWAAPGNGSVILVWNTKKNEEDEEAVGYRVEYGSKSVALGEADEYEATKEIDDKYPTAKIEDIKNGTEYFFVVIAVFADGTETPPSEEVSATPLSELVQEEDEAPIVISAESLSRSQVTVVFSEEIVLPDKDPENAFNITLDKDDEEMLEVKGVEYDVNKETGLEIKTAVILETEEQTDKESYRVTVSALIIDTEGNPIQSGSTDNAIFAGTDGDPVVIATPAPETSTEEEVTPTPEATPETEVTDDEDDAEGSDAEDGKSDGLAFDWDEESASEKDTTPPEDVTNFAHTLKARISDFLVSLTWTASKNSAKDLDDQLIYRSADYGKAWGSGKSLGDKATSTTMTEKPETEITYKITTKDVAGNESVGAIHSVSLPALPATGPGLLIPGGIALMGLALKKLRRKE